MYDEHSKQSMEMLDASPSHKILDLYTLKRISSELVSLDFSGLRPLDGLSSLEEPISSREP